MALHWDLPFQRLCFTIVSREWHLVLCTLGPGMERFCDGLVSWTHEDCQNGVSGIKSSEVEVPVLRTDEPRHDG